MKRITVIAILGAFLLSGCSPSEKTQTVEYYMEHDDIRAAKIKECANNPGELGKTPNCQNAMTAENRRILSSENKGMPKIR
ncbi:hypothetical protein CEG14_23620 [Bordetella genomosp. 1]|uniref:EexN family lipoprotein n=1 Tax=Bordetella genomosp. 1 TaxID=1395607 RepID=A0A261RVF0_9BORD|nr:EexN family lipoprotein [Bordetella genomosp. 1]OZI28915.1 hypothetical protein CEG14_23620 [Bordetella genomosp. 1]